jgi:hypothetical protein
LKRAGRDCRSISKLEIVTSGRLLGRAPKGFAEALAAHDVLPLTEATI